MLEYFVIKYFWGAAGLYVCAVPVLVPRAASAVLQVVAVPQLEHMPVQGVVSSVVTVKGATVSVMAAKGITTAVKAVGTTEGISLFSHSKWRDTDAKGSIHHQTSLVAIVLRCVP